ncbi:MAG: YicC family protein [Deltaproteobacteria bacterium]|nr:YicC family protein [Deltaproteobacteria bacterium]
MEKSTERKIEKGSKMLRSMTGFSKVEKEFPEVKIYGEARSLNNRYLELNIKIQKVDYLLEQKLREIAKKYLRRGRVDISLKWGRPENSYPMLKINEENVSQYISIAKSLKEKYGLPGSLSIEGLLSFKDVIMYEEHLPIQEEKVFEVFEELLRLLDADRKREGKVIEEDLRKRLANVRKAVEEIEIHFPLAMSQHEQRLKNKLKEATGVVSEERILEEMVIYMERYDMAEEISRLKGHIDNFENSMNEEESVGRKLDFIIQEMIRETNTIGSKSPDYFISEKVVIIKVEIEKLREQVQNVE